MAHGPWLMVDATISRMPSALSHDVPCPRPVYSRHSHELTPLSSCAVPAIHRQRLRRADLRDRLVSAPAAGHRIVVDLARHPARHVHGRHVSRQPAALADRVRAPASAARLRRARARHRRLRAADPGRHAARRPHLHGVGGRGHRRHHLSRRRRRHLPAAADRADGRDAARDLALGEGDAGRRRVARVLLRRQHRRRRHRQPRRRVLSAARLRRRDGDDGGGRRQHRGLCDCHAAGSTDIARPTCRPRGPPVRRARGRCTRPSASRASRRSPPR